MKLHVKEKTRKSYTIELTRKEAKQLLEDLVDVGVPFDFENWQIYPAAAALQQTLRDRL